MIHVVALLANAGHGKTSAANFLVERYDAKIVSLAGPLKQVAQRVMNFSDTQLWGTQAEKEAMDPRYGFSAREFLRRLGTEGLREAFGDRVHLDALAKRLAQEDEALDYDQLYVVDDCRFPNEAEFFACPEMHEMHSAVIKIVCTDAPAVLGEHASETGVDQVPPEHIAATVVSSRGCQCDPVEHSPGDCWASGVDDLCGRLMVAFEETPRLARFRRVLQEGASRAFDREVAIRECA